MKSDNRIDRNMKCNLICLRISMNYSLSSLFQKRFQTMKYHYCLFQLLKLVWIFHSNKFTGTYSRQFFHLTRHHSLDVYHTILTFRCNGFPSRRGTSNLDTRLLCSYAHLRSRGSHCARRSATGAGCRARWHTGTGPRGTVDNLKLLFPTANGCIFLI